MYVPFGIIKYGCAVFVQFLKIIIFMNFKVSSAAQSIEPLLSSTLVGSYRRGKDTCGDIDVMITKPDHLISKDILSQLLKSLKDSG